MHNAKKNRRKQWNKGEIMQQTKKSLKLHKILLKKSSSQQKTSNSTLEQNA